MQGHEHEWGEPNAESIQNLVRPRLLDIVDKHGLIIPFFDLLSTANKYLQTVE